MCPTREAPWPLFCASSPSDQQCLCMCRSVPPCTTFQVQLGAAGMPSRFLHRTLIYRCVSRQRGCQTTALHFFFFFLIGGRTWGGVGSRELSSRWLLAPQGMPLAMSPRVTLADRPGSARQVSASSGLLSALQPLSCRAAFGEAHVFHPFIFFHLL